MKTSTRLVRSLRGLMLGLVAIIIFIEEWGWRPLTAWAARVTAWAPLAWIEARVRRASPRVALACFLVPAVALFPVKLAALWFIQKGHVFSGIAVIIAAKLLGTACVGRLFIITEPQLMQFRWFAKGLRWWRMTKRRVKAQLDASATYQQAARRMASWRARLRERWGRRRRRA